MLTDPGQEVEVREGAEGEANGRDEHEHAGEDLAACRIVSGDLPQAEDEPAGKIAIFEYFEIGKGFVRNFQVSPRAGAADSEGADDAHEELEEEHEEEHHELHGAVIPGKKNKIPQKRKTGARAFFTDLNAL